jgi:hypothetical protein
LFVVLLVIDPTSHELGSPAKPARFNKFVVAVLSKQIAAFTTGIDAAASKMR